VTDHICTKENIIGKMEQSVSDMEHCKLPKMQNDIQNLFKYANDPESGSQHRLTKLEGDVNVLKGMPKWLVSFFGILIGVLIFISSVSAYISYRNSETIQTYIMSQQGESK
jgi:hypothetical protein